MLCLSNCISSSILFNKKFKSILNSEQKEEKIQSAWIRQRWKSIQLNLIDSVHYNGNRQEFLYLYFTSNELLCMLKVQSFYWIIKWTTVKSVFKQGKFHDFSLIKLAMIIGLWAECETLIIILSDSLVSNLE